MRALVDYHIHTKMCGHARGEMEEYVLSAIEQGMKEIGFADHLPMYFREENLRDSTVAMTEAQVPEYIAQVQQLQNKYPQLNIKCGIEADFIPGKEQALEALLQKYSFDYVLGSIHFLDEWGFDDSRYLSTYDHWSIDELYEKYFRMLSQAAASGYFDILAHPDLIKKFGFRPQKSLNTTYSEVVGAIRRYDLCVELNTAGLRYPAEEMYPTKEFLETCFQYQVPVSLGSDAHCPEQVGMDFEVATRLLRTIGYRKIATFTKRKRTMVDL